MGKLLAASWQSYSQPLSFYGSGSEPQMLAGTGEAFKRSCREQQESTATRAWGWAALDTTPSLAWCPESPALGASAQASWQRTPVLALEGKLPSGFLKHDLGLVGMQGGGGGRSAWPGDPVGQRCRGADAMFQPQSSPFLLLVSPPHAVVPDSA